MGILDMLKGLLGGTAKPAVEPAFTQGESEQVIVHRHSGFRFPQAVGDYAGVDPTQYDEKGLNVSVGYNHTKVEGLAVTVYVYPNTGGTAALPGHCEECKAEVASSHGDVKVLSEAAFETSPNGSPSPGRKVMFSFSDDLGGIKLSSLSELWLFSHGSLFIKYRATYPDSMKSHAPAAVEALIKALAWP
ncbi:MAG: hypothetical protein WC943_07515 [Elusimicrobiota bacterium]